jgi:enamine deaminase RidA (YjgF/YER057c/UK114 family)
MSRLERSLFLNYAVGFVNVPTRRWSPSQSFSQSISIMSQIEKKLEALGLQLPPAPKPVGLYKPMLVVGNLAYLSGHGPLKSDGTIILGRVGADLDVEGGKAAAQQTALAMLATLKAGLGSLDRVARVVKLLGLVRCTDEFGQSPLVINGCSQVFVDLWGSDLGVGVRSALGTNSLPGGMAVEVEGIFEIQ